MNMEPRYVYRVQLKVSYYEKWFEFDTVQEAGEFAEIILSKQAVNEDHKEKPIYVNIKLVDKEAEAAALAAEKEADENADS